MIIKSLIDFIEIRAEEQFWEEQYFVQLTSEPETYYLVNSIESISNQRNLIDLIHRHISAKNIYLELFGIEGIPLDSAKLDSVFSLLLMSDQSILEIFKIYEENIQAVINLLNDQEYELGDLTMDNLLNKFIINGYRLMT